MKILILDTYYYKAVLNKLYRENPSLSSAPYADQIKKIMSLKFGTGDFYSRNLKQLGHQAEDVISNAYEAQHQWAKENGVNRMIDFVYKIPYLRKYLRPDWTREILHAQIMKIKPDVLYCQDVSIPGEEFIRKIKKELPLFIIGQISYPTTFTRHFFSPYDLMLTSFPHYLREFKKIGVQAEYFRIGFDTSALEGIKKTKKQYPVTFVGGFSSYHQKSYALMEWVAARTKIDFWGYGYGTFSPDSPIIKNYHGEAWGRDMYQILYNSKIVINRHGEVAKNSANNMRLYEATGVGSMLITDYKDNLKDMFILGKEIETYRTKEELLEKIRYYSAHEPERKSIALAGQKRTLKDHTYFRRMKELEGIIYKYIGNV